MSSLSSQNDALWTLVARHLAVTQVGMELLGMIPRILLFAMTALVLAGCSKANFAHYNMGQMKIAAKTDYETIANNWHGYGTATSNYQTIANTWKGGTVQQLQKAWGRPSNSFTGGAGNNVYIYSMDTYRTLPVYNWFGLPQQFDHGPAYLNTGYTYYQNQCAIWVESKGGVIVKTYARGNNCLASTAEVGKYANPSNAKEIYRNQVGQRYSAIGSATPPDKFWG